MRNIHFLSIGLLSLFVVFLSSCKKEETPAPAITFTEVQGLADSKGEYLLTGTILSDIQLDKVILTKEGTVSPNLTIAGVSGTYTDNSTAKNKTEYDFAYQITGVTENTYLIIDIYDQNGTKKSVKFLIKK